MKPPGLLIERFQKPHGQRAARSAQPALISEIAYHDFAVMPHVHSAAGGV